MQTSRIVLANEPRLLRGMLRRVIAEAPGLEVVDEVTNLGKLSSLANQSKAQWVIVSIWPAGLVPSAVQSLLVKRSTLCILGMAADGSKAKIVCPGSMEETLDELSLDDLIEILQKGGEKPWQQLHRDLENPRNSC